MANALNASTNGQAFIKQNEGFRSVVYDDGSGNPTVGWGHMDRRLKIGETVTQASLENFFQQDLKVAENAVNTYVNTALNQNQFDALVDFVFNIGVGRFRSSTLLAKLNQNNIVGAADQFLVWDKPAAILGRRQRERELFLKPSN